MKALLIFLLLMTPALADGPRGGSFHRGEGHGSWQRPGDWHGGGGPLRRGPEIHYHNGPGLDQVVPNIIGGAIGSWLWNQWTSPPPPPPPEPMPTPTVGPAPFSPEWMTFCQSKYKSFDAHTGYYTGYDGIQHFCSVAD